MPRVGSSLATDESGASLLEWVVVTAILTLAIFALLQVIGPDVQRLVTTWLARLR